MQIPREVPEGSVKIPAGPPEGSVRFWGVTVQILGWVLEGFGAGTW